MTAAASALVFDYGQRRIGVASASRTAATATALETVDASRVAGPDWAAIDRLVAEWRPAVLVVGLPYNDDGTCSPMTERVREFAVALGSRYALEVELVDERFTSAEAEDMLREERRTGRRRRRIRKGDVDRLAARLIAESWLRS